ncbi:acyl-coenzyme A thioesterase PaaI-like protein [Nocardioides daedukensis]|uniref:Acyl-coenzyme A thioesterase PaaI-like protein n=1 Tax=Nocardioides daedukensis TaxID=634462 RepID=A0A7Y9S3D5_9ACTN|nr:DUF4442 domain-containing protein [Nocardioides daedukensis]NYG60259.1 acyl-coenzyme A thioesterase PaaI-like protein [Nocardioides daedukensis]
MNLWPPYVAAGIKVLDIADDWTSASVRMRVGRFNANYFGTAFGGSLSAMSDPFYTLLATNQLGRDYLVWDTAGEIEFVTPGTGEVFGTYHLSHAVADEIRAEAANGQKHLRWFETDLTHADGTVVARVRRQVYVRLKRR